MRQHPEVTWTNLEILWMLMEFGTLMMEYLATMTIKKAHKDPHKDQIKIMFQDIQAQQEAQGLDLWAPFADKEEWGTKTSHMKTSFTSKYLLLKAIDKLPQATKWKLRKINVVGNRTANDGQHEKEDLELWLHDLVDCIHELMSNPEFDGCMSYAPEKVFADKEGKTCMFDGMWTGDWWWEMQHRLPQGAVVVPMILALDKTSLSQFCGDQEVWPMYLTLGNISKDIHHQPSKHAAILIAYLPISELEYFTQDIHSVEHYQLFHYCMAQVLEPLVSAGVQNALSDVTTTEI
ncbi:uncharacterized protein BJ212DRAFT_1301779 [Suillus subaureus]|uniref:Uncharacterized protein n=1 Tax=Suillus subaureus TaxID=48587 RepID=A0A9P7JAH3_9AGAM|nr:uncharacterized protein BJ212DRAFT_1301779 [Suillus subaureus]KAG1811740.1 hypothetical protein BJ212DRAFT_1301779 [Suillus subaureus]